DLRLQRPQINALPDSAAPSVTSDGVVQIEEVDANAEFTRNGFAQRFYAVALGRVVTGRDEGGAAFIGQMEVLLRGFAGDVSIDSGIDGGFHHVLGAARAPCHRSDLAVGV